MPELQLLYRATVAPGRPPVPSRGCLKLAAIQSQHLGRPASKFNI